MLQSFQQFNQDKSIDQWEVWFGEQAPRGGNSFVQKINPKKRLSVHPYICSRKHHLICYT